MPEKKDFSYPEGSWGIHYNASSVPLQRWDPFRTIKDEYGTLIGHNTHISPNRRKRPHEWTLQEEKRDELSISSKDDSFCQLVAGKSPAIVICRDIESYQNPLSFEPKFEDLRLFSAISLINLYSPIGRKILSPSTSFSKKSRQLAMGFSLVHLITKHFIMLEDIPTDTLALFFNNLILSHKIIENSAKERGMGKKLNTMLFINVGPEAGASIPHFHAQSYLSTKKQGHGWKNQSFLVSYEEQKRYSNNESFCIGCQYSKKVRYDLFDQELFITERIIYENDHWLAFTAFAPERDGHIRIIPKNHYSRLNELTEKQIFSLADALKKINSALTRFIREEGSKYSLKLSRNILFRQQHLGYESDLHMLIEIIPIQQVGGAEILDDYRIASLLPETAAKKMRYFVLRTE